VNAQRRLLRGLVLGAIATVPMTAIFLMGRAAGTLDEVPPRKVARRLAPRSGEPALSMLGAAVHLLIGAGSGAAYALLSPRIARGAGTGALYGVALWAIGYEVVMPAVTDLVPAHRDRRRRALTILLAHTVYGTVLGRAVSSGDT
jgi:hypothetical protein